MDINDLRSLATVSCFLALVAVFVWAFHPKHKKRFEQDGLLPFDNDELDNLIVAKGVAKGVAQGETKDVAKEATHQNHFKSDHEESRQ